MKKSKSILFLILAFMLLATTTMAAGTPATITVYGDALLEVAPDQAQVSVGVETQGTDVQSATAENARLMEAVMNALGEFGSAIGAVSTGSYQVYSLEMEGVTQYRVSNLLNVTIKELDQVGPVIDRLTAAGANRIHSLRFETSNQEAVKAEALRLAVAQAREKARILAAALDGEITGLVSVEEEGGTYTPYQTAFLTATRDALTKIYPEDVQVSARVKLVYQMEPATSQAVPGEAELEGPSLQAQGLAIPEEAVVAMTLVDIAGNEVRSLAPEEIVKILDSLNTNPTYTGMYPMILVGHQGILTLQNGEEIHLSSFGSEEYVVVSGKLGETFLSQVVRAEEVARLLLADVR